MDPAKQAKAPAQTATGNGGFPAPPAGESERVVRPRHGACGQASRIVLPGTLPPSIVKRVRCDHCSQFYNRDPADDAAPAELLPAGAPASESSPASQGAPAPGVAPSPQATPAPQAAPSTGRRMRALALTGVARKRIDRMRDGRAAERSSGTDQRPGAPRVAPLPAWAWLAPVLAVAAVVVGVILLSGRSDNPADVNRPPIADPAKAKTVNRDSFSLALPDGWRRTIPPGDALFAAASEDGLADATLWVSRDIKLKLGQFERASLARVREIAGSAEVTSRVEGETRKTTIVEIRGGNGPDGNGSAYRVTLRAAGDIFYYLATSIAPGAPPKLSGDAEILHTSLVPTIPEDGEIPDLRPDANQASR